MWHALNPINWSSIYEDVEPCLTGNHVNKLKKDCVPIKYSRTARNVIKYIVRIKLARKNNLMIDLTRIHDD